MGDRELLIQEVSQLPDPLLAELLDFVRFLKAKTAESRFATAIASESALAKDWLTPEEDVAWQDL